MSASDRCANSACRTSKIEVEIALEDYWVELGQGTTVLVEHFVSSDECYALLQAPAAGARPLRRPQRELLQRLLAGEQQKAIALELGTSRAAVAQRLQRVARQLGVRGHWAQWPLFLLVSGVAFHANPKIEVPARLRRMTLDGREYAVCSFARPDHNLLSELSAAEREVARLVVEGASHAEIAERRGTSARTVDNQLAAVFAKLGVSGRVELLLLLMRRAAARRAAR